MPVLHEYATLSAYVYGDANRPELPQGWAEVAKADGYPMQSWGPSGYYGALFQDSATGNYALVSRGLERSDRGDWQAGLALMRGQVPRAQLDDMQAFLAQVLESGIPLDRITFAGHSLGGALSQIMAALQGRPAVTFNAPGVKDLLPHFGLDPDGPYDVTDVVDEGDSIPHWRAHIGNRIVLPAAEFPLWPTLRPGEGDPPYESYALRLVLFQRTSHLIETVRAKLRAAGTLASPLLLDLDGDGVETTGVGASAYFDHDGDGLAERTGWVGPGDGLLAWDRNGNDAIDSGVELFGDHTMAEGARAPNGYAALAELDTSGDGVIDARDAGFGALRVWKDANRDGLSSPGELLTLPDAGVLAIGTAYTDSGRTDQAGNVHGQVGTFSRSDGGLGATADVWFQTDRLDTVTAAPVALPARLRELPDAHGYGAVHDLSQAMARDATGTLESLVRAFVAEPDPARRTETLEQILLAWTGSDGIDPESRGPWMDARELAVLEKFAGESYVGFTGASPHHQSAPVLVEAYRALGELVYAQLMMQSHLRDLYGLVSYARDEATGTVTADLGQVAAALDARLAADPLGGRALLGEFARTLRGFQDGAMADYWGFRERFASRSEELGWAIDSAGKGLIEGTAAGEALTGTAGADAIRGGEGADNLWGDAGDDALYGGPGADYIEGWSGDDILAGGADGDQLHGRAGSDRVDGGPGADFLFGHEGADTLAGGDGEDGLWGLDDDDRLDGGPGDDYLDGGAGADVYAFGPGAGRDTVMDAVAGSSGVDTISVGAGVAPADVSVTREGYDLVLRIAGTTDALRVSLWFLEGEGYERQVGRVEFADGTVWDRTALRQLVLRGTAGADTLTGYDTADTLTGLDGADTLQGAAGDDRLDGGPGDDSLDGGPGADTLTGGAGDDTYVVDQAGDRVTELSAQGTDTVLASVSFTLGANVERLTLTGSAAMNGTGNSLPNLLIGNGAANTLSGGSGADTLMGGAGNDTYVVDHPGDVVVEAAGQGTDTVRASVTHSLPANVEKLVLTGSGAIGGTGNELPNSLTGNSAANLLDGGPGADTLAGGRGNDTYRFARGSGADRIVDNDATTGNADTALFGSDIRALDLVLTRSLDHLVIAVNGTADRLTVDNWYRGAAYRVETLEAVDGSRLASARVDALIQAMAGFSVATGLSWAQAAQERPDEVQAILAAHWQPAASG